MQLTKSEISYNIPHPNTCILTQLRPNVKKHILKIN